jgi:hypothetical protein
LSGPDGRRQTIALRVSVIGKRYPDDDHVVWRAFLYLIRNSFFVPQVERRFDSRVCTASTTLRGPGLMSS